MSDANGNCSQINGSANSWLRKAIGERLTQHLVPDAPMPQSLQRLIDELHRQEMRDPRAACR